MLGGRKLLAVATSGPSGGFLPAQLPVRREKLAETVKKVVDGAQKRDPSLADQVQRFADKYLLNTDSKTVPLTAITLDLNFFRNVTLPLIGLPTSLSGPASSFTPGVPTPRPGSERPSSSATSRAANACRCRIGSEKFATVGLGCETGQRDGRRAVDSTCPTPISSCSTKAAEQTSICGLGQVAEAAHLVDRLLPASRAAPTERNHESRRPRRSFPKCSSRASSTKPNRCSPVTTTTRSCARRRAGRADSSKRCR